MVKLENRLTCPNSPKKENSPISQPDSPKNKHAYIYNSSLFEYDFYKIYRR